MAQSSDGSIEPTRWSEWGHRQPPLSRPALWLADESGFRATIWYGTVRSANRFPSRQLKLSDEQPNESYRGLRTDTQDHHSGPGWTLTVDLDA